MEPEAQGTKVKVIELTLAHWSHWWYRVWQSKTKHHEEKPLPAVALMKEDKWRFFPG